MVSQWFKRIAHVGSEEKFKASLEKLKRREQDLAQAAELGSKVLLVLKDTKKEYKVIHALYEVERAEKSSAVAKLERALTEKRLMESKLDVRMVLTLFHVHSEQELSSLKESSKKQLSFMETQFHDISHKYNESLNYIEVLLDKSQQLTKEVRNNC